MHPSDRPGRAPDQEDEDEDEEDDEEMLERLQKLSEDERNKAMGKIFALKFWPWPSPTWWIINARGNRSRMGGLEAKKSGEFISFLGIDMGLSTEDWMHPNFRRDACSTSFTPLC